MRMQSISEKLPTQIAEWLKEITKAIELLELIKEMSNADSAEGRTALGFDIYENYKHCFAVSFFPYKSIEEMSEMEKSLSKKVSAIAYDEGTLYKIKVFMSSLEECEYLEKNKLRITFR